MKFKNLIERDLWTTALMQAIRSGQYTYDAMIECADRALTEWRQRRDTNS